MTEREFKKYFSYRIQNLLIENKWSQGELARRVGCAPQAISFYVTEHNTPSISMLIKLANTFGLSVSELLDFSEFIKREAK